MVECPPRRSVRAKASFAHGIPAGPSSVRAKASFAHGIPAGPSSVRAKASSAHRIPVGPSSVRAKASFAHGIPAWSSFVRDQAFFAHEIQRLRRGKYWRICCLYCSAVNGAGRGLLTSSMKEAQWSIISSIVQSCRNLPSFRQ